jgi:hypothetical protein
MKLLAVVLAAFAVLALADDPHFPTIPGDFHWTFSIINNDDLPPYSNGTGEQWISRSLGYTRVSSTFQILQADMLADYNQHYLYNRQCIMPPAGSSSSSNDPVCVCRQVKDNSPFPDLDMSGAVYQGREQIDGQDCYVWQAAGGGEEMSTLFYVGVSSDQIVRIVYHTFSGDTQLDVISFEAGPQDPAVFDVATVTKDWDCQPMSMSDAAGAASEQVKLPPVPASFTPQQGQEALKYLDQFMHSSPVPLSIHPMLQGVNFDWCAACQSIVPGLMGVLCGAGGAAACALTALGAPVCGIIVSAVCAGGHAVCAGAQCAQIACRAARLCT